MKSKHKFLACLLSATTLFSSCPGFTTCSHASSLSPQSKKAIGVGVGAGLAGLIFAAVAAGIVISKKHNENNAKTEEKKGDNQNQNNEQHNTQKNKLTNNGDTRGNNVRIVYFKKLQNGNAGKNFKYKYFSAQKNSKVLLPFPEEGQSEQNTKLIGFVQSHPNDLKIMFKELCSADAEYQDDLFEIKTDIPKEILNSAIIDEDGEIKSIGKYESAIVAFNKALIAKMMEEMSEEEEESEDVSEEELEQLETKVKEIPLQSFQVESAGVNNCQKSHDSGVPKGEGDAKLKTPYRTSLMRVHLNEALALNNQGVTFNSEFFECRDIPKWRTRCGGRYGICEEIEREIQEMFWDSEFLRGLQFEKKDGTIKRFREYVFGKSADDGGKVARINIIKDLDINLYCMFYNELLWIKDHKTLLNERDKDDPVALYEYRLRRHVDNLNDECSTELRSLIEAWAQEIDGLENIEKGETTKELDVSTISNKILTQIRIGCLEELAQKVAINVTAIKGPNGEIIPNADTKIMPEIQEVVRYQCAQALNVPSHAMNEDHVEYLTDKDNPNKYDLVYKTNLLSSIMTVEAIASYATNYAKAFG
ncbi:MAG: hypothetical protein Q4D57_06680, partial [Clostridia bacterium]|nr:hypothetical protein [Clostridia bacterium]